MTEITIIEEVIYGLIYKVMLKAEKSYTDVLSYDVSLGFQWNTVFWKQTFVQECLLKCVNK